MCIRSRKGMRVVNLRYCTFFISLGIWFNLICMPSNVSALANLLKVQVDTVYIDEATTIRDVTASFPYYVFTRVKVYDEFNHYVPRLASRDQWLKLGDITEGGQPVSKAWRTTLEYHAENTSIPAIQDVKSNPDYFAVTETRIYDYDLSMMLVMDYSKSIDDITVIQNATLDMIHEINGRDPLGIIKFSDGTKVCQTLTTDMQLLESAITDSTIFRNQTMLYSSIDTAINHLQYREGRRVVVVYTDGKNEQITPDNPTTIDDVIAHAKEKHVELYVVGLGGGIDEPVLKQLASETGGKYYYGEKGIYLEPIFLNIYGDFRGYYVMRHMSTDPYYNGTWRWVEVEMIDVWKGGRGKCKYFVPYHPTDVRVSKTVSSDSLRTSPVQLWYAMASDTVTYTIQVENKGKSAYPNLRVVDMLGDSVVALSKDMTMGNAISLTSLNDHRVEWNVSRLDGQSIVEIEYKAKLDPIMPMNSMPLQNYVQLYGDTAITDATDDAVVYGYGQPDFTVDPISPSFIASPTQVVTIEANISNQGNAHADQPFRISFEYQGQILAYDTLQTLGIGVPAIVSGQVSFPSLGSYQILVRADVDKAIKELNEKNNTALCTLTVDITDLGAQISDVNFRDTIRNLRGKFPSSLLTTVNVLDQNAYPVHDLAEPDHWTALDEITPAGVVLGNVWKLFHETYRDIPNHPVDSNIRPGMQATEFISSSASWVLMVSTGGVPGGWFGMVKPALISFTASLQSGDRVAIMASHGTANTVQSFTSNGTLLKQSIQNLSSGNGSRLWNNLISAIDLAASRTGRQGVIAVIGGNDQNSTVTHNDVILYAQQMGVPLYLLGLENQTNASILETVALASGGYYWSYKDTKTLREKEADAERLLRNYYVLHHSSSDTLKNLSWRQLDLGIEAHGFSAQDKGIYQAPKGIHDIAVYKTQYSKTFQIENGDTIWTVQPGDSAFCNITISNEGDYPMYQISVEDSLPDNLIPEFTPFASQLYFPHRLQWQIDTLLVGQSLQYQYDCFVDTLAQLSERDIISYIQLSLADDELAINDSDHDTLHYIPLLPADLSIQKTALGDSSGVIDGNTIWYVSPQDIVIYQLTIQNDGEMPAKSIEVKDVIPQYLSWIYSTKPFSEVQDDTLIWEFPRLNGHGTKYTWTYACRVDSMMPPWDVTLVNMASAYSQDDATSENNVASDSVVAVGIEPPWPDINVNPTLIYPYDSVNVYVTTPFSTSLWDLEVILGDGSTYSTYADAFISNTTLVPNQSIEVEPDFSDTQLLTQSREEIIQIVFKTVDIWGVTRNDTTSMIVTMPDLMVEKRVKSDSLIISQSDSLWYADFGEVVIYTVTLTNLGKLPCHAINIQDVLAPNLTFLKFDQSIPYTYDSGTLSWQLNTLNGSNDQIQYRYQCKVSDMIPPWIQEVVNTVTVTGDRDWDLSNNEAEQTLFIVGDIPMNPSVFVTPPQSEPGDSVQVRVMSPIDIAQGKWHLSIVFEDGSIVNDYAQDFIQTHTLKSGDTLLVRPAFDDTRMRNNEVQEQFQVILETTDSWQANYYDTTSVTLQSGDAFWLDNNVYRASQSNGLNIRFRMSSNRHAKISIYDISGGFVETVVDGPYFAGWNQAFWNGTNRFGNRVGSGVYLAVYTSGDVKKAHKFIVVR